MEGGSLREGWLAVGPERRLADDGKRPYRRWTLCEDFEDRVGSLGEGMAPDRSGYDAGGFIKILLKY